MCFMAEVSFWRPLKSVVSCNLFIIIILIIIIVIIINFFGRIFSECTEANATSLIPLVPFILRNGLVVLCGLI